MYSFKFLSMACFVNINEEKMKYISLRYILLLSHW